MQSFKNSLESVIQGLIVVFVGSMILVPFLSREREELGAEGLVLKIVPTGTVVPFAGKVVPQGWAICDGSQKLRIADAPELFEALGGQSSPFGADQETFSLPNLSSRVVIGADSNTIFGKFGGSDFVNLTADQLPPHSHPVTDPGHLHEQQVTDNPNQSEPRNLIRKEKQAYLDNNGEVQLNWHYGSYSQGCKTIDSKTGITIGNSTGKGSAIDITPKHLALKYIIKM